MRACMTQGRSKDARAHREVAILAPKLPVHGVHAPSGADEVDQHPLLQRLEHVRALQDGGEVRRAGVREGDEVPPHPPATAQPHGGRLEDAPVEPPTAQDHLLHHGEPGQTQPDDEPAQVDPRPQRARRDRAGLQPFLARLAEARERLQAARLCRRRRRRRHRLRDHHLLRRDGDERDDSG